MALEERYVVIGVNGVPSPPITEKVLTDYAWKGFIAPDTVIRDVAMGNRECRAWDLMPMRAAFVQTGRKPAPLPQSPAPQLSQDSTESSGSFAAMMAVNEGWKKPRLRMPEAVQAALKSPMPDATPLSSLLPESAPQNAVYALREYGRQYLSLKWITTLYVAFLVASPIIGFMLWPIGALAVLFVPGVFLALSFLEVVVFCLAIYAFFQRPALRRKVAEMGIDSDAWHERIEREFWSVAKPILTALWILIGVMFITGIVAIIAGHVANGVYRPDSPYPTPDR